MRNGDALTALTNQVEYKIERSNFVEWSTSNISRLREKTSLGARAIPRASSASGIDH